MRIGFAGAGRMGGPMAARLASCGYPVAVFDNNHEAARLVQGAAFCAASPAELASHADLLITMLPNGDAVRAVALEAAPHLPEGALIVDMSSSSPTGTIRLAAELAVLNRPGLAMIDAPVSGGVSRAGSGKLTIMASGREQDVARAMPVLAALGSVTPVGKLGAGHALKALNNYVSAAGLAAACEAILIGREFGLDPEKMLQVFNTSTGQNFATTNKMAQFVLSGTFASGFALNLLAKDLGIAEALAADLHLDAPVLQHIADLFSKAEDALGDGRDHTEVYRYLADRAVR